MRPSIDLRTLFGSMAVIGMLALSGPGVVAVRADPAKPAEIAPGPSCQAGSAANASVDYSHVIEYARRQAAKRAVAQGGGPEVLNNRGYNYGSPSVIDPKQVLADDAHSRTR